MQNMQNSVMQLQNSLTSLQTATSGTFFELPVQSLVATVSQLTSSLTMQPSGNQQQIDTARQQLTNVRMQLQQLRNDIEKSENAQLNLYRNTLGDQKETFEALPPASQQLWNSQAYSALQAYRQDQQLLDILQQINSEIMDLSQAMERKSKTFDHTQTADTGYTGRQFTNDPGPSSLSP